MRLLFDLETNGLPDWSRPRWRLIEREGKRVSEPGFRILCGAAHDLDTGDEWTFADTQLCELYSLIGQASELVGHNVAGFDLPVLDAYAPPGWKRTDRIFDTLLVSRQMFPHLSEVTAKIRNAMARTEDEREAVFPRKYMSPRGLHGLAAWGYRLGFIKGSLLDVAGVQEHFSQELLDYCLRDVQLNAALYHRLREKGGFPGAPAPDYEAMVLESRVGWLLGCMSRNGVRFDVSAGTALYAQLAARRDVLTRTLKGYFPDWYVVETFVPKRTIKNGKYAGRVKGVPEEKKKLIEFNPSSDQHLANRLQALYGWKPKEDEWTESGLPKMDDAVLQDLTYEPIPTIIEFKTVEKRIGQLAEGPQAWLRVVKPTGLIHHNVSASGARTSRMSHSGPNLAQVPKVGSPYGEECRAMFGPTRDGWVMVGADASGIELRKLAHRLAYFDQGAFAKVLLEGDPHTEWMKATKLFYRDSQKTATYAFLYGAGDNKLGKIALEDWRKAYAAGLTTKPPPSAEFQRELGKDMRRGLMRRVVGLEPLIAGLKMKHKQGWLRGLDGRAIQMLTEHGALNDLLQSDAAIVMKHAWWGLYKSLELTYRHGVDYAFMLFVHDEWQIECRPEIAESVGRAAVRAIQQAGEELGVRCPLDGEYKIGSNWQETH